MKEVKKLDMDEVNEFLVGMREAEKGDEHKGCVCYYSRGLSDQLESNSKLAELTSAMVSSTSALGVSGEVEPRVALGVGLLTMLSIGIVIGQNCTRVETPYEFPSEVEVPSA